MFTIEKVPQEVVAQLLDSDRRGVKKYPFAEMQVGDSFTVDQGQPTGRAKSAARAYAARTGTRFSVVREGLKFRVIRIA